MKMITVSEDALNSIKEMAQKQADECAGYRAAMEQALPLLFAHNRKTTEGSMTINLFKHLLK